ncbi:MAG: hypothetical protein JWR84_3934 [Caulobacter sp.]|nr:hypothetical protein [Caulobacter sp.]
MIRVSWLPAVLLALLLSGPLLCAPGAAFARAPEKITDGPPKTIEQQKAEAEAEERLDEEEAWKAFKEAEKKYEEARARNADKINQYDDAIEAWRKANPSPAGTKETMISSSVDYETALYESATVTWFNKYNIPTHTITFGPDAKPLGPVTQTQQGKAWETIGPEIVKGGVFGLSYGTDFDGNQIITRAQIGDEHGYRTAEMQFNFEGIAWRTEYWGEDGLRKGGQEDLTRRPPPRTMGGPLDVPRTWRAITGSCAECQGKTDRYNELVAKANELIGLMAQQSKMHETAWPEAQKPIKLRFRYLKRQLDELLPQLQAAEAEALACHKICRPPAEPPKEAVLTSPAAPKLPTPDLTRPGLLPVELAQPPASFCDEFARVAYMNEVYTPAAKASLANARTATEHLGKLGGMFTDYMKNEGGPGWAAVRAEQTAYAPVAEEATAKSNAVNALYQQILAVPIVPCPNQKPRIATGGDPVPAPAAPVTDGVGVIPVRAVETAGGKKPCPPKQGRKPITVGSNGKVGSGAKLAKDLGKQAIGMLGGALGLGGGGGGGGDSDGPPLYKCRIKDSEMTVFDDPATGVSLKVGAKRGKGDVVNLFANIAKSPDQGTFQTAFLEKPNGPNAGQVQAPFDVGPCDLWGEWKLTVSWTKDTYVDGQHVDHQEGGWSETGKFVIPGMLSKESAPTGMWRQMGFSSASHGAREAFMAFHVPPGGGPLTFVVHVTRPGGDPVTTAPFVMTMTETAPGVFTFEKGEVEDDCPDVITETHSVTVPMPSPADPLSPELTPATQTAGISEGAPSADYHDADQPVSPTGQIMDEARAPDTTQHGPDNAAYDQPGRRLAVQDIVDDWVADDLILMDQMTRDGVCQPGLREALVKQVTDRQAHSDDYAKGETTDKDYAISLDAARTKALLDWLGGDPDACRPPGAPPKQPSPGLPPPSNPASAPVTPPEDETAPVM